MPTSARDLRPGLDCFTMRAAIFAVFCCQWTGHLRLRRKPETPLQMKQLLGRTWGKSIAIAACLVAIAAPCLARTLQYRTYVVTRTLGYHASCCEHAIMLTMTLSAENGACLVPVMTADALPSFRLEIPLPVIEAKARRSVC
jgi:hypothetical protein